MRRGSKVFFAVALLLVAVAFASGLVKRYTGAGVFEPETLALLEIEGAIFDVKWYMEQVKNFRENDRVKGVVLRIDSPGGAIAPTQELYQEIQRLAQDKAVVVSMGTVAASGGYYLACAADWIVASPGTITGSIGVIMELTNVEELFGKIGLKARTIKSGAHKDMGSPFRELTAEEEELLGALVMDMHEQFVEAVLAGRPVEKERVLPFFDGRILTGRQALELGLVDEMGNINNALMKASELAGLPEVPDEIIEPKPKRQGLVGILFGTEASGRITSALEEVLGRTEWARSLQLWRAF